jgi:hypothetical protein
LEVFIEDREHEFLLGLEDEVLVGGTRNVILLETLSRPCTMAWPETTKPVIPFLASLGFCSGSSPCGMQDE